MVARKIAAGIEDPQDVIKDMDQALSNIRSSEAEKLGR
jgi:O-acetylhomoserine/O-acetylserine sulfhydrylase-like pyridoxal-dependent enzyme